MNAKRWLMILAIVGSIVVAVLWMRPTNLEQRTDADSANNAKAGSASLKSAVANNSSSNQQAKTVTLGSPINEPVTFAEAIGKMPEADQAYLKAFNDRTYGLLNYTSKGELQWKLDRAFPTVDQVLKLRDQPAPRLLTNAEMNALSPQDLALFLVHRNIVQGDSPLKDDKLFMYDLFNGNLLLKKIDSPLPAYLAASQIDPTSSSAASRLTQAAVEAVIFGDNTLAMQISTQLSKSESTHDLANTVGNVGSTHYGIAQRLYSTCVNNRYTGNPRTVESLAKAMRNISCN